MSNSNVEDYAVQTISRRIAGEIVMSPDPGASIKKWREYFEVSQQVVAKAMGVSPSVVSDYEKGRRLPGSRFIQRFVRALIQIDMERGWIKLTRLMRTLGVPPGVIIDMREFERPLTATDIVEVVDGILLSSSYYSEKRVYGYTVIDSIRAIASLSGTQFYTLLGGTPERVVVFTGVRAGRSPMVAVRVSPVKPSMIVLHGPRRDVDPLAIRLADLEGIPLILSTIPDVKGLVERLRSRSSGDLAASITGFPVF